MNNIFLDCDLMRFPNSGLYHYCLNLGIEVQKLLAAEKGIRIKMYVPSAEKESFESDTIVEKKWHKFWKPFLRQNNVWHTPFQSGRMVLHKKTPGIKKLLTIHDLNPLHEGKSPQEQQKSLAHTQQLIDQHDAIVCISEFTKTDVLKHCEVGNKPLFVIHNGIHHINSLGGVQAPRKFNRPFLFGMGYVNRKKNYHTLLPILTENPNLELVVAGRLDEPDYVKLILDTAEKMQVSDRLHLTGPVSENDKAWYLSNCEAFVHPSLAEGFGAPVVEAMLFGKPLFLSNLTSLPEIGGKAAFYFSNFEGETMTRTFREGMQKFADLNMRETVIQRGQDFNWQRSARQYLEVYKSLLQ